MVKSWKLAVLPAAVLLLGAWWLLGGDRDLRLITRQSDRLAAALHKGPEDGLLGLATRAHDIAGFFALQAAVTPGAPLPPLHSRDEIVTVAASTLHLAGRLAVTILDRELSWVEPHVKAAMRVAVEVDVEGQGERQQLMHTYELTWIREEKQWVIADAHLSETIRPPAASGQ